MQYCMIKMDTNEYNLHLLELTPLEPNKLFAHSSL